MWFGKRLAVVLGAGPAGLLAAHAARELGYEVQVFTAPDKDGKPKKSELHGCQYLHAWIPGLGLPMRGKMVQYLLNGDPEDYRRKVYGDGWNGQVSPDEYGPERAHPAWDLRQAYDALWEHWHDKITPLNITPKMAERVALTRGQHVLCTVPVKSLCLAPEDHKFVTQTVWAMGERFGDGAEPVYPLPYRAPDMTVQCDGEDAPRWYRAATVFGVSTLEWPGGAKPPISGVTAVSKPLSTDCTCHTGPRWHRVGRYGLWRKGVLVHTAYEDTKTVLR